MIDVISFKNANSRDTYFSVHKIKPAHMITNGKSVRVGIIDWLFAIDENPTLYSGSANITGEDDHLHSSKGHGFMMATTLREIAPECEIYAINGVNHSECQNPEDANVRRIEHLEKAIDWAINSGINILTYSNAAFYGEHRVRANWAVEKAANKGLMTTFIHNDSQFNIFPYGCFGFVNIYHMDYNSMFIQQYERYIEFVNKGESIRSGNDLPFFSFSSMSPVLAGFVALIKCIKPKITLSECKKLLIETSYEITEKGANWYDLNPCKNVVDIEKAVKSIQI
jgi:hypothetical protein